MQTGEIGEPLWFWQPTAAPYTALALMCHLRLTLERSPIAGPGTLKKTRFCGVLFKPTELL